MKVNVGAILAEHWTQDPALGGGPAPIPLGEILGVSRVTIEVAARAAVAAGAPNRVPMENDPANALPDPVDTRTDDDAVDADISGEDKAENSENSIFLPLIAN